MTITKSCTASGLTMHGSRLVWPLCAPPKAQKTAYLLADRSFRPECGSRISCADPRRIIESICGHGESQIRLDSDANFLRHRARLGSHQYCVYIAYVIARNSVADHLVDWSPLAQAVDVAAQVRPTGNRPNIRRSDPGDSEGFPYHHHQAVPRNTVDGDSSP
jgi:hypothetical protein